MKILVTGGTGYIGSHAVVELIDQGFDVVIIDNLSNSKQDVINAIGEICGKVPAFFAIDLADEIATRQFFRQHNDFDGIIHFAAYKAVGESVEKPLKYYHNNLFSLINILKNTEVGSGTNLVFSSSSTVYGNADILPVTENTPFKPAISPYGNTKKIAEEIIMDTVRSGWLHAISLRYFNPIGAHDSGLIGELPIGVPNNLVPYITQTATGKRDFLRVYGNDYDTPDGTPIRDYIHVVDLAKAHVVALNRIIGKKQKEPFEAFNLGTGKGYSVMEIIDTFEKITNTKLHYRIEERRPGDVTKIYADTTLANEELGWRTERGLENMLNTAWRWEQYLMEHDKDYFKKQ